MRSRPHREFVRVAAGDVDVIPEQNRAITRSNVLRLIKYWDRNKVAVLRLNDRRDGKKPFVMVGQHSVLAAREKFGDGFLFDAILYHGLSREEEAEIWLGHDVEVRRAAPLDVFRQKLEARRPEEMKIYETLATHGLRVAAGNGSHVVGCPVALGKIFRDGVLEEVLTVAESAWTLPDLRKQAWQIAIISGLGSFLAKYGEVDQSALVAKLRKVSPDNLAAMGRSRMERGSSVASGVERAILDLYNKGRRSRRLS